MKSDTQRVIRSNRLPTTQPGLRTEINLTDNTIRMEVEGDTLVSVQHRDKTECSRRNNRFTTR